jgi:hypothetical protein
VAIDLNFILAVAIFVSGILTPIIASRLSLRQSMVERREEKLKEQREYLIALMQSLIKLRAKLQFLHHPPNSDGSETTKQEREELYGEAFGIMLSINDLEVRNKAKVVMESEVPHEKLVEINFAIMRLGEMIDKLYSN